MSEPTTPAPAATVWADRAVAEKQPRKEKERVFQVSRGGKDYFTVAVSGRAAIANVGIHAKDTAKSITPSKQLTPAERLKRKIDKLTPEERDAMRKLLG